MGIVEHKNAAQPDDLGCPNLEEDVKEELDRLGQGGRWVWYRLSDI